jgi:hypothetical protein
VAALDNPPLVIFTLIVYTPGVVGVPVIDTAASLVEYVKPGISSETILDGGAPT